jgi:hypothetical protein
LICNFHSNEGKRLVECILEGKRWPKSIPKITDSGIAHVVAGALIQNSFFHRSEKVEGKKGYLKVNDVYSSYHFSESFLIDFIKKCLRRKWLLHLDVCW